MTVTTRKTPCFYRMLNALDRFVNADTEPTQEEKASLVNALGEYITADCSPKSREYNRDCFTQAMRSVKALLPEKDFEKVVEQVNVDRSPKVKAADFDAPEPVMERTREINCEQGSRREREKALRDVPQMMRGM